MDPRTGKVYEIGEDNTFVLTDSRALMNSVNSPLIINERNCIHFCKHCAERNATSVLAIRGRSARTSTLLKVVQTIFAPASGAM